MRETLHVPLFFSTFSSLVITAAIIITKIIELLFFYRNERFIKERHCLQNKELSSKMDQQQLIIQVPPCH